MSTNENKKPEENQKEENERPEASANESEYKGNNPAGEPQEVEKNS